MRRLAISLAPLFLLPLMLAPAPSNTAILAGSAPAITTPSAWYSGAVPRDVRVSRSHVRPPVPAVVKPRPTPKPGHTYVPTRRPTSVVKAYAYKVVGSSQYGCFDQIITAESHWNPLASSPSGKYYGMAQFGPTAWKSTGIAKTSDPFRQIDAAKIYMDHRYGSPCEALAFRRSHGWY